MVDVILGEAGEVIEVHPGRRRYEPPVVVMTQTPSFSFVGGRANASQLRERAEVRLIVSSIQVLAEGHGWERWGNLPRGGSAFMI